MATSSPVDFSRAYKPGWQMSEYEYGKHPNWKLQTHGNAVMQTSVGLSGGSDLPLHVIIECLICIQRG